MSDLEPYYTDELVTLYHGDCRNVDEWLSADVLVTDPPYGISYVSDKSKLAVGIAGDDSVAARDGALARWGSRPALVFGTWKRPRPFSTRHVCYWHKAAAGPGMGDLTLPWGNSVEEIYVLGSGWHGTRRSELHVTNEARGNPYGAAAKIGHPTPKPIGLMEQLLDKCPPGIIADPFAGSGATLIAARNLGRRAIGVEIDESYCKIIADRLAQDVLDFGPPLVPVLGGEA
jgi:site-specific DNA-methyltransferase (adenine-specific)